MNFFFNLLFKCPEHTCCEQTGEHPALSIPDGLVAVGVVFFYDCYTPSPIPRLSTVLGVFRCPSPFQNPITVTGIALKIYNFISNDTYTFICDTIQWESYFFALKENPGKYDYNHTSDERHRMTATGDVQATSDKPPSSNSFKATSSTGSSNWNHIEPV